MDGDTKRFYDLTAVQTADQWYPNDILLPTIRAFLSFLPRHPRILDLGCGPGHESLRLFSQGATVLGLDFSEECIRVARERCPRCQFHVADFRDLDTRFGKFHGVFAAGSLIHIPPDDLSGVLNRIAEILQNGGYLLAIVQDGQGARERWHEINSQRIRRILYQYQAQDLADADNRLKWDRELRLADELMDNGWRAHLLCRE